MPEYKYYRLFRGGQALLSILFGITPVLYSLLLISPGSVMRYFGIYALLAGLFLLMSAHMIRLKIPYWYLLILEGAADMLTGLIILAIPRMPYPMFFTMAGVWTIVNAYFLFLSCRRTPEIIFELRNLIFLGVLCIPTGIMLIWHPIKNSLGLFMMLGIFSIIYGIVFIRDLSGAGKSEGEPLISDR